MRERRTIVSEWQFTLGKPISWDEGYLMPRYPRHIAQAFLAVDYDEGQEVAEGESYPLYHQLVGEAIQQFAKRWGGLDDAVFVRALQEAQGRDRLVAIFALGCNSALVEATELLVPWLSSLDQLERCAAACMLALRRDERALPVLEEYLLREPPQDEQGCYLPGVAIWYYSYRCLIAGLLATWGPSSLAWVLRQAFLLRWESEKRLGIGGNVYDHATQDALCYALGRRGALGALHGIELPARKKRIAMIYLALGYVQADERFERLFDAVLLNGEFEQELMGVLVEHFALSVEESRETIRSYANDINDRRIAAGAMVESRSEIDADGIMHVISRVADGRGGIEERIDDET